MNGQGTHKKALSDHELDQLFRDAHASEHLEPLFVESYWNEMEAMLPVAKKKRWPVYLLGAAAVIVALLVIFPLDQSHLSALNAPETEKNNTNNKPFDAAQDNDNAVAGNEKHDNTAEIAITQAASFQEKQQLRNNTLVPQDITNTSEANNSKHETIPLDERVIASPNDSELTAIEPLEIRQLTSQGGGVTGMKKNKTYITRGYIELGATGGQSPYINAAGKREIIGGIVLGAGASIHSGHTYFNGGVQLRMEAFQGLSYKETNFTAQNMTRTVQVNQLYSVEFPLSFGYRSTKHQVGINFTPGIQCFISGKESIYTNTELTRENQYVGPVQHSSSMTMELGLNYYYHFNSNWALGVKVNTDMLRPFRTDYYQGENRLFPINGQLILRRNIF